MEYLKENNLTLKGVLSECLFMNPLQKNDIEVIKYQHFIEILVNKIGIELDGHDLSNMKQIFGLEKSENTEK